MSLVGVVVGIEKRKWKWKWKSRDGGYEVDEQSKCIYILRTTESTFTDGWGHWVGVVMTIAAGVNRLVMYQVLHRQ